MEEPRTMTLLQLQQTITRLITVQETQMVWVTAELSDVAVRGGHCYMELLQKDPASGSIVAKSRAVIWASIWSRFEAYFRNATGQAFATGLKVMVRVSVSYHAVFGMTLVVSSVNPEYTMGDLLRRRREIIQKLEREGIIELNRQLTWPEPAQRIAIISARNAAGYGDFLNQLYHNTRRLKFISRLFPATMQGDRTVPSILSALDAVTAEHTRWDCVVIIRGGGASSDLAAFDNYDLAAAIARFPIPVIIGIGHERDITVLDYVANMRVKTPTAAAEWLIQHGSASLDRLRQIAGAIQQTASDRLSCARTRISNLENLLPVSAAGGVNRAAERLRTRSMALAGISARCIAPAGSRLDRLSALITATASALIERKRVALDNYSALLDALSPQSTLRRGYSITRINGSAVTSPDQVKTGDNIVTITSDGIIESTVK